MEPALLTVGAIMSPRSAGHFGRCADTIRTNGGSRLGLPTPDFVPGLDRCGARLDGRHTSFDLDSALGLGIRIRRAVQGPEEFGSQLGPRRLAEAKGVGQHSSGDIRLDIPDSPLPQTAQ
jgi:hypothetical protein